MTATLTLFAIFVLFGLIAIALESDGWGALCVLALLLALGSCTIDVVNREPEIEPVPEIQEVVEEAVSEIEEYNPENVYKFWIDPETGCQYIVNTYEANLTIRYDENGNIMCPKNNEGNF